MFLLRGMEWKGLSLLHALTNNYFALKAKHKTSIFIQKKNGKYVEEHMMI